MQSVRKTFFNPLASSKAQVRALLETLPHGSAHPYSPEGLLLCRTADGIEEIDISSLPEEHFYNAVDLGQMGEVLAYRMDQFSTHLSMFASYTVLQVPSPSFKIPIVSGKIFLLAISQKTPTYYDLCLANEKSETCCYNTSAHTRFSGLRHSGDINSGINFLAHIRFEERCLTEMTEKELCVFISGYQYTPITRFSGTHPALLLADHANQALYMIPVPLDSATIGEATICCPLVIKKEGEYLQCSVLPAAATDTNIMCTGLSLPSPCWRNAIEGSRVMAATSATAAVPRVDSGSRVEVAETVVLSAAVHDVKCPDHACIITPSASVPASIDLHATQIIKFSSHLEFVPMGQSSSMEPSNVILPCAFGTQLEGPILLAVGKIPNNVPFTTEQSLHDYFRSLQSLVVIVDDQMTDNARNLAPPYRLNGVFVVQPKQAPAIQTQEELTAFLNDLNINAVTALAGPQSLILVQVNEKYLFYRGMASRQHLNTTELTFGADLSQLVRAQSLEQLAFWDCDRLIDVSTESSVIFPISRRKVPVGSLQAMLENSSVDAVRLMQEDISYAIPQLQVLLDQKPLQDLSRALVAVLSKKIDQTVAPLRSEYVAFGKANLRSSDPEVIQKKARMLGELRKQSKQLQATLTSTISGLSNMMSARTTSKRTHDLKRLLRQSQIDQNVEVTKSMTFETLADYLETHASEMGVMLLRIDTRAYWRVLESIGQLGSDVNSCCALESRNLYLDGLDAGIILEQSQGEHHGPLRSALGPKQPVLALASSERSETSMLAWVCWDEFVDLTSPFTVRWMEKCNEAHIAALRIIMRSTLSEAVCSRKFNFEASSIEIGKLMGALLMAAMSKLAAMRTTAPSVTETADDTVTKLMRGLFGNLLTIAGSGVRPMSMVWQLFGTNSQNDLPSADADWIWYEVVVKLYPYTGWPMGKFLSNLRALIDKAILRVITKNENVAAIKANRVAQLIEFCKLRNVQLAHSRTIIVIFTRMLTDSDVDAAAIANRLLQQLPRRLKRQSQGYTRMILYLDHLANGGQRRQADDAVAANIYTRRSGVFAKVKEEVAQACADKDWGRAKLACQSLFDQHAATAALWGVDPDTLTLQNAQTYRDIQAADFDDEPNDETKRKHRTLLSKIIGDAEPSRVPWQVGKPGQFGPDIEPLDEGLVHIILTGKEPSVEQTLKLDPLADSTAVGQAAPDTTLQQQQQPSRSVSEQLAEYESSLQKPFVETMQKDLSPSDVCQLLGIPESTFGVFVQALNPNFSWASLGERMKSVILDLLQDRTARATAEPVRLLLALGEGGAPAPITES